MNQIKTLIVDDEGLVRKGIRIALPWESYGIKIIGEASSAEKALLFTGQNEVDLLITDITMPGMSGLELMSIVRERHPLIWMVVLTCHQDFELIQEALRLGAIDYIVKTQLENQDVEELLERIVKRIIQENRPLVTKVTALPKSPEEIRLNHDEIVKPWVSLTWVLEAGKSKLLAEHIAANLTSLTDRKALLTTLCDEWQARLPWINGFTRHESIRQADNWGELILRLGNIQDILQSHLRATLYSEEVLLLILKSLDFIQSHVGRKINQSELSSELNISRSYFSRSFKDIVGIPFVSYVQELNIGYSRQLLLSTNHPIYWIADQSGFQDERYFSKIFRKKTGMLPSEYRLKHRNASQMSH